MYALLFHRVISYMTWQILWKSQKEIITKNVAVLLGLPEALLLQRHLHGVRHARLEGFDFWNLETVGKETISWDALGASTSLADDRDWQLSEDLVEKVWVWEKNVISQDRRLWCLFLLMDSWSWHRASNAHRVAVPSFDRCRSERTCLGTCELRRGGARSALQDMAASAAMVWWRGGAQLAGERRLLEPDEEAYGSEAGSVP